MLYLVLLLVLPLCTHHFQFKVHSFARPLNWAVGTCWQHLAPADIKQAGL
jgi:hypothetical protein